MIVHNLYPHLVGKGWVKKKIYGVPNLFTFLKGIGIESKQFLMKKFSTVFLSFFSE